mmetsp:Transcript_18812/g.40981  ORF Transcript_18812/g.40981 Transcript_18812/m.40981 type:complete len:359 (-) Transcript_18812:130-1206(-)
MYVMVSHASRTTIASFAAAATLALFVLLLHHPNPVGAIIDGVEVDNSQFPYIAAILRSEYVASPYLAQFCGGALIACDVVLTAAHCLVEDTDQEVTVGLGFTNLTTDDEPIPDGAEVITATRTVRHPDYDKDNSGNWDFGLIFLERASTKPTIAMADECFDDALFAGEPLNVAGWGDRTRTKGSFTSSHLKATTMNYISNTECTQRLGGLVEFPAMLCARTPGTKTCQGDSGGPLVTETVPPIVVGQTSFGFILDLNETTKDVVNCATIYPTGFARTSDARAWISSEITKHKASGDMCADIPSVPRPSESRLCENAPIPTVISDEEAEGEEDIQSSGGTRMGAISLIAAGIVASIFVL